MTKAAFKKGQTVYQPVAYFAETKTHIEMRVVSRTVDSCGAKQITFVDHGFDSVFGKRALFTPGWSQPVFATPEEAFAQLEKAPRRKQRVTVINPMVTSDSVWVDKII